MKRTNDILIATLAGVALSLFIGSAQAQYQATGKGSEVATKGMEKKFDVAPLK